MVPSAHARRSHWSGSAMFAGLMGLPRRVSELYVQGRIALAMRSFDRCPKAASMGPRRSVFAWTPGTVLRHSPRGVLENQPLDRAGVLLTKPSPGAAVPPPRLCITPARAFEPRAGGKAVSYRIGSRTPRGWYTTPG
jgi:hypothetical protein